MEDKLEKIDNKLDKIAEDILEIKVTLAQQAQQITYHIKRTDLLEEKLEPIQKHVNLVQAVMKFTGILIAGGCLHSLLKLLGYL